MPEFRRARHRLVWELLESLNRPLLASAQCFFGGGTRIVLELDEFRESVDVDFLCSDRSGYRVLRGMVTERSFGEIFTGPYELLRDIRTDMYGIRTFLLIDDEPLKFEIISEGRISVAGAAIEPFPVEVLDHSSCIAEKLLANADRGRDESTKSRDLIDLAFMAASWPVEELDSGMAAAEGGYGSAIRRDLGRTLDRFRDLAYRRACVKELAVSAPRKLTRGLGVLRKFTATGSRS